MQSILFLAILHVFTVCLATGQCPNSTWIQRGSKCYFVKKEKGDFLQNIALCNQLNASLVSIVSKEENDEVSQIANTNDCWLGLGRNYSSNSSLLYYHYWLDERQFIYNNWEEDLYVGVNEYFAVHISNGKWYSALAFGRYCQMCSIDLKQSTPYKKTPNPDEVEETLVSGQCPNSNWIRRGNTCYLLKWEDGDFYENIALCNQLNASMVSIVNEKENIEVARLTYTASTPFWLGLGSKANTSYDFYWFDERPFEYNSWKYEPGLNDNKYKAANFQKGSWYYDSPHSFFHHFQMCLFDLNRTTPYKKTPNPAEIKATLVTGQCPNSTWVRLANKCYFVKRVEADLFENIALCNQLNASLISITSEEENIQVTRFMISERRVLGFWLGLGQRSKFSNELYWFDGRPFVYNSWGREPEVPYNYFGAYSFIGEWSIDPALELKTQVCSLDLSFNDFPTETPLPADLRETEGQCADKRWKRIGNKCIFCDTRKRITLWGSQNVCKELNATMVSIHSDAENIQLSKLSDGYSFWIGLKQTSNSNRSYEWEDGSPVTYESWWNGYPKYLQSGTKGSWAAYSKFGDWFDVFMRKYEADFHYPCCQISLMTNPKEAYPESTTDVLSQ